MWTRPTWAPLHRALVFHKDFRAQSGLQVLKDYVNQWKLVHFGALPTADELTASGVVGLAHAWRPQNLWTACATYPETNVDAHEYTLNGDGTYTLLLHQDMWSDLHGQPGQPATYTAQWADRPHSDQRS